MGGEPGRAKTPQTLPHWTGQTWWTVVTWGSLDTSHDIPKTPFGGQLLSQAGEGTREFLTGFLLCGRTEELCPGWMSEDSCSIPPFPQVTHNIPQIFHFPATSKGVEEPLQSFPQILKSLSGDKPRAINGWLSWSALPGGGFKSVATAFDLVATAFDLVAMIFDLVATTSV